MGPSDQEAAKWWLMAAEQGDEGAQCNLANFCFGGRGGLPQSDGRAAEWWRKAASRDEEDAQYMLGYFYETGRGGLQ